MTDFMQKLAQTESRELFPHHHTTTSLSSTRSSNGISYTTNDQINDSVYGVSYQKPSYDRRQEQSPPIKMTESTNEEVAKGLMRSRYYHNQGKQGDNSNDNGGGEGGDRDGNKKLSSRRNNKRVENEREELIITKDVSESINRYHLTRLLPL